MKFTIAAPVLATALTLASVCAHAQPPAPGTDQFGGPPPAHAESMHEQPGSHDEFHGPHGPAASMAVLNDLQQLHRLYLLTGHEADMARVYQDVLDHTQDPLIRHFVRDSIVRMDLKPSNPAQAIETLRAGLQEDLANANLQRPGGPAPAVKQRQD